MPSLRPKSYEKIRHRDIFQRVSNVPEEDFYLSPTDGHLAKLVVQAVDDVRDAPGQGSWRRTFVRNISSPIIRLASWACDFGPREKAIWTGQDWPIVWSKWVMSCLCLALIVCVITAQPQQKGQDD